MLYTSSLCTANAFDLLFTCFDFVGVSSLGACRRPATSEHKTLWKSWGIILKPQPPHTRQKHEPTCVTMFQKSAHLQPGFSAGLGLFGAGFLFVYIFHPLSAGFASFKCRFCPFKCRFCLFKCRFLPSWEKERKIETLRKSSPSCPLKHAKTCGPQNCRICLVFKHFWVIFCPDVCSYFCLVCGGRGSLAPLWQSHSLTYKRPPKKYSSIVFLLGCRTGVYCMLEKNRIPLPLSWSICRVVQCPLPCVIRSQGLHRCMKPAAHECRNRDP